MCVGFRLPVVPAAVSSNLKDEVVTTSTAKDVNKGTTVMSPEPELASVASRKRPLSETHVVSDSESDASCPLSCPRQSCSIDIDADGGRKRSKVWKRTGRKQSVRFGDSQFISSSSSYAISEDDKKELWYGLDDCALLNASSSQTIRHFRDNDLDSVRHVICIASQCSHSPPPRAYLDTVRLRLPDEIRGLEMAMMPSRVRQQRQQHVKRVVGDIQQLVSSNKLRCCGGKKGSRNNNEESKEEIIASHARRSSQASRLFAELLGREVADDVAAFGTETTLSS